MKFEGHQKDAMDKIHAREAELGRRRLKKMRRIQRDSKQVIRKYANAQNLVKELAKARVTEELGSDSEPEEARVQNLKAAMQDPADEDYQYSKRM